MKETFAERMRPYRVKHGLYGHPLYQTWNRMRHRCLSPKDRQYKNYGGRGITICREWDGFAVFLRDMGEKPSAKHSLDRKDNNGNYSKDNCRWATWEEQENNRRINKFLTYRGETMTKAQWAHKVGIGTDTLGWRIKNGWGIEKTLTTPT